MKKSSKGTLVTGVIGSDTHIVGNRILSRALEQAGFEVVALGALTPASEFVDAAIETNADAISGGGRATLGQHRAAIYGHGLRSGVCAAHTAG